MGECGTVVRYNCNKGERMKRRKVPGNKWFGLNTQSGIKPKSACTDFVYCWASCLHFSLDVAHTPSRKRQTGCRQTNEGWTGNDEKELIIFDERPNEPIGINSIRFHFSKRNTEYGRMVSWSLVFQAREEDYRNALLQNILMPNWALTFNKHK